MNNNGRIYSKEIFDEHFSEYVEHMRKKLYSPKLISSQLVSVQPMSLPSPTASFFYLDYVYESTHVIKSQEEKPVNRLYSDIDPYGEEDWGV
jgi:hypothetical protein